MFNVLIVGLGQTGMSIGRYCARSQQRAAAWEPEMAAEPSTFKKAFPQMTLWQGAKLPDEAFDIPMWVLSPGVPLEHHEIEKAQRRGIIVTGDVTLFAQQNTKPILAVTGSNGKSTVVSLLEKMVAAQGLKPALLGNIGTPVLDGLAEDYDYVILELSSFQLDITEGLAPEVACVLNVTPDHLDRHHTLEAYADSKRRIYIGAAHAVCNLEDPTTYPDTPDRMYFSMKSQDPAIWHYDAKAGELCFGKKRYNVRFLPIHSEIHYANVLAALAMIHEAGFDTDKAFDAACTFTGLPHRLVLVAEANGIKWFDDSKATNVGATLASIDSVSKLITGRIVILLGGLGKGASFECLQGPLKEHGRAAILIGEAQMQLESELKDSVTCIRATTFEEAVVLAHQEAQAGDAVLLAPACASWDMFKNYGERGDLFTRLAREITSLCTQTKE
ncbi:MAG: UDP-N-acetylmuramoyl-L-alanine--D-glutamate ligase [Gammaproteobacteria bacterium]